MARIHRSTIPKRSYDLNNHNGVVTNPEPDTLECEVKWALGNISKNKTRGGDQISLGLFKILKDDAVKVLNVLTANWKTHQWPQNWKRSVFIRIPKKDNAKKNVQNYHTAALISHASKVMFKILQVTL